jgi:hypothetical protein
VRRKDRTPDEVIGAIASRSYGVISRMEMLGAGISGTDIDRRARRGALIRVHRGVYRVGHRAPSIEADYLAAVRACGSSGLLCGRAAAFFLSLIRLPAAPGPEVAARSGTQRRTAASQSPP